MRPLWRAAARAVAKTVYILQSLASHLPMTLPRVGNFILWYCAQNRLPDVVQQRGKLQADAGDRERQDGKKAAGELAGERRPPGNRPNGGRGESRKEG